MCVRTRSVSVKKTGEISHMKEILRRGFNGRHESEDGSDLINEHETRGYTRHEEGSTVNGISKNFQYE